MLERLRVSAARLNWKDRAPDFAGRVPREVVKGDTFNNCMNLAFSLWPNVETYVFRGVPKVGLLFLWA